jgi:hypothetical protein
MVPQLSSIVNELVYHGQMKPVLDRCGLKVRHFACEFRKFVNSQWGIRPSSVVWLDASGRYSAAVKHGTSKVNEFFAITSINLAPKLLRLGPDVTVAMLTAYAGQRNILLSAHASMQLDPALKDLNLDNLTVGTVDSLIGTEYLCDSGLARRRWHRVPFG